MVIRFGLAIVTALVGVAGCTAQTGPRPPDVTTDCGLRLGQQHSPAPQADSAHVFTNEAGLVARIYVQPRWAGACTSNGAFSTVVGDSSDSELEFFGGIDAVFKAQVLFGRVPKGTQRVEATLASGRQAEAQTDGEVFVIWRGAETFEGTSVTAHGPLSVLGTAQAPTELESSFDEQAFRLHCQRQLAQLAPGKESGLSLRLKAAQGNQVVWVYDSPQATVACHWSAAFKGGSAVWPGLSTVTAEDAFGPYLHSSTDQGWLVGVAPAGALRVEIVLDDGAAVLATLEGRIFAVSWESRSDQPFKLVAHTAGGIYTWADRMSTFTPRPASSPGTP